MAWLIGFTFLGLLFLGLCLALLVHQRGKVDNLLAVIRAQRRRIDEMETNLVCLGRKQWGQIEPSAN